MQKKQKPKKQNQNKKKQNQKPRMVATHILYFFKEYINSCFFHLLWHEW